MESLRLAIDMGGTFTDLVILDEKANTLDLIKVPKKKAKERGRYLNTSPLPIQVGRIWDS